MRKIVIYPNTGKKRAVEAAKLLICTLLKYNCNIFLPIEFKEYCNDDEKKACVFETHDEIFKDAEIVLTLGGDGTLLRAARHAALFSVPVLGINVGKVGYLTSFEADEIYKINAYFENKFKADTRMMLNVKLIRSGKTMAHFHALNEAVISKGSLSRMICINICANGVEMREYSADGVIIATPTGSTAYSLSAGGPVIEPSVESILLTSICPHVLNVRPVLFSSETKLEIKTPNLSDRQAFLTVDGEESIAILESDIVTIEKSIYKTIIFKLEDKPFFEIFSKKLMNE